tara:strand:+ start:131 stop:478 length:348 start_codon:yes stop_codon:yes gene_type:complete
MKTITEKEAIENPTLEQLIGKDSELKRWIVDYVGINSEEFIRDDEITVQMIVNVFAKEFPEFLLAVAEENWIRGYHQALEDVDAGRNAEFEEANRSTDSVNVNNEGNLAPPLVAE